MFIKRPVFQKKYVAFFTVVPLLVVSGLIQVEDPVCGGTGVLSVGTPGMENVRITDSKNELKTTVFNACGMYLIYNFDLRLTIENSNPYLSQGWIKTTLVDVATDRVLAKEQYVPLEVPAAIGGGAETPYTMDVTYSVWYQTELSEGALRWIEVYAEVVTEDFVSPSCNGTGKIPLNAWPLVNALKESFREAGSGIEKQYEPPVWYVPTFE